MTDRSARNLGRWLAIGVAVLLVVQLVPYGWRQPNPPVSQPAPWPSREAATIAGASCLDCHSNNTRWPWYASIAPMSWLVRRDVEAGREDLNFSSWDRDNGRADDAVESIEEGAMPPRRYLLLHPEARLSREEARILVDALRVMER